MRRSMDGYPAGCDLEGPDPFPDWDSMVKGTFTFQISDFRFHPLAAPTRLADLSRRNVVETEASANEEVRRRRVIPGS